MILYVGNDNGVLLKTPKVLSLETGQFVPLAPSSTVQFRVQTLLHVDVPGDAWPQTMTYTNSAAVDPELLEPGEDMFVGFIGVVRKSVQLVPDQEYLLVCTADGGTDMYGAWELSAWAQRRDLD